MTIEEQLKQEILSKYKSVRAFTTQLQIPYTTLDSVFKRGISKAGIETMLKVFDALDLDIESISEGKLRHRQSETKKIPSTAEAASGKISAISLEDSTRLLISLGFIQEGEDISDEDLAFVSYIVELMDIWFRKRK